MNTVTRKLTLFAATGLFAVALTACSGATPSTTANPPAAQSEATATSAEVVATEVVAAEATVAEAAADAATTEAASAGAAPVAAVAMTKLNLNTVTGEELLATIPDFGNRMVREFEEYRPYVSIQQFRREIGKYVDEAQVAEYEKYVYVPINVNEADADTLKQIAGVEDADTDALIAARPYESNDAFLAKLAEVVSADELAARVRIFGGAMSSEVVLSRLRTFLFGLAAFLLMGTVVELAFAEHWGSITQMIPFILCGLGFAAIVAVLRRPQSNSLRILRWVMAITLVGSLFGVFEHIEENINFALEIKPSTAGLDLILKGLGGANPLLAPGMLAIAALMALAATYYHPAFVTTHSPQPNPP